MYGRVYSSSKFALVVAFFVAETREAVKRRGTIDDVELVAPLSNECCEIAGAGGQ